MRATRISRRALEHAIGSQQRNEEREFERLRTELLNQITDDRVILDKTRIEIGTLQANFQAESQQVQRLMSNYTNLFTEYLPRIHASIQQLDVLRADVSGWGKEKGHRELMQARAILYSSIKGDEVVQDSAVYCINVFKTKLELAKQQVQSVPSSGA
jgi:hypothetical protein